VLKTESENLEKCNDYLTYLQEYFKPVAHRSASVEVFDEEDVQVVHLPLSCWVCLELQVMDA
jgi:hypothetical protein